MDVSGRKYYEAPAPPPSLFVSHGEAIPDSLNMGTKNPFLDSYHDPLCELNLKETSDFVKSFPMAFSGTESKGSTLEVSTHRKKDEENSASKRSVEAPPTPGRPVFSFSVGNLSRKSFPSKWDDAEKWLASSTSCHESPANHTLLKNSKAFKMSRQCNGVQKVEVFAEKSRVTEEKVSKGFSGFQGSLHLDHHNSAGAFNGISASSTDVLLKDKFTNEVALVYPNFRCSEPMKEGFLFGTAAEKFRKDATTELAQEVKHRDVGTEMTPIGSSTTSRCHTPFKNSSPARHNTPANRSGLLALANINSTSSIDMKQFQECHQAKMQFGSQFDSVTSNWSSREEEEEDISKSLRHCEISNEFKKSVTETRACAWEDEEKNKCCLRYQREEAKIQAWMNLQKAKAEAQSRKLEVKIQKMRSNLEEKIMKRMASVHRKAEDWRATAELQHSEQIQKITEHAQKMVNRHGSHSSTQRSCSCFPCNKHQN